MALDPAGEATARVLGGYRRTAADRGRGQAAPLRADGLAAILATAAPDQPDLQAGTESSEESGGAAGDIWGRLSLPDAGPQRLHSGSRPN